MNNQKILTAMVSVQDGLETANDNIEKLELLLKLATMRVQMVEGTIDLRIESLNLRIKELENVVAGTVTNVTPVKSTSGSNQSRQSRWIG